MDHVTVSQLVTQHFIYFSNISCNQINPDGSAKMKEEVTHTYTHAMKLWSSLTYGFGHQYKRGTTG